MSLSYSLVVGLRGFNDDMIRRSGLPPDVMSLLHDLCYHHEGRDVWSYVNRAQLALMARRAPSVVRGRKRSGARRASSENPASASCKQTKRESNTNFN